MTTLQQWAGVLALVAIVIAIGAYGYPKAQGAGLVGSSSACTDGYTCLTNLETQGNQIVDGTTTLTGTTTAGNLNITTTNTATSSIQVGCVQTYATSTASPLHYVISSVSTTTTTFGEGTSGFAMIAVFGKCPRI